MGGVVFNFDLNQVSSMFETMADIDFLPPMEEIAGYVATEFLRRLSASEDYLGNPLKPSKRAEETGGKTLVNRGLYQSSYNAQTDGTRMEFGTNDIRAGVLHFGAKQGEFGRYSQVARYSKYGEKDFRRYAGTKKGFPLPWGDIPARKVAGFNDDDEKEVFAIFDDYMQRVIEAAS